MHAMTYRTPTASSVSWIPPAPRGVVLLQLLAVSGYQTTGEGQELWLVQFYNCLGEHIRSLRVPGSGINGIAWEGSGLRLALAVDSHIFFTSMRHSYLWAYFADTLVYAFTKAERQEHCVMFWGTRSNERYAKYVKRITHVAAAGEFCLLPTKVSCWGVVSWLSTLRGVRDCCNSRPEAMLWEM